MSTLRPLSFSPSLLLSLSLSLLFPLSASAASSPAAPKRPNVLFIAVDDLRNDLGALGAAHPRNSTPSPPPRAFFRITTSRCPPAAPRAPPCCGVAILPRPLTSATAASPPPTPRGATRIFPRGFFATATAPTRSVKSPITPAAAPANSGTTAPKNSPAPGRAHGFRKPRGTKPRTSCTVTPTVSHAPPAKPRPLRPTPVLTPLFPTRGLQTRP